jgi:hypothetical protein
MYNEKTQKAEFVGLHYDEASAHSALSMCEFLPKTK